jgi:NhaP-type Na+/H+ or K+/H+ antiporter
MAVSRLPADLRHTIIAEAGANDALAYPLVMLPILIHHLGWQAAAPRWAWETILWQVIGSTAFGAAIGYGAQRLLNRIRRSADADPLTLQTVSISLAVTVAGGVKLIHGEGLLAVFVAGLFLNRAISGEFNIAKKELNENLKRFLDIPVFILFGMVLPWRSWIDLGPAGPGLAVAVLVLRRLPAVLLLRSFLPTVGTRAEGAFMGWFGPIGIAALYYAHVALAEGEDAIVWHAGSLIIFASLLVHGASATPLTDWLGRLQGRVGGGVESGVSGSQE